MTEPLRLLVIEDSEDDYELLLREIRRGFTVESARVETAGELRATLAKETWDLIISDFSLPGFGAMAALDVLAESGLDIPFIIVSGTIGEDIAVEALKRGAHDFMVKDRLARLVPAMERELRDAKARQAQREAEDHRKKAEAQLMVADRMVAVGTLAAGVAHEINNPLAALMANLELALADLGEITAQGATPERTVVLREELEDARAAAERVRNIVRDLKIFSRGGDHERRGPVDVARVMDSSLRMARNEIRHRAKVITRYENAPPVDASESRLGQIFLNLIVNAAQAMPEGRADRNEIRIAARATGNRVVVEVTDTGPGIPPDVMRRLFTPFVTTKPVGVGTGLGLSICHRLVTELGGEITAESEPGKGATFRVVLPAATGVGDEQPPGPAPSTAAPRRGRILVIDDEPMVAKAVERTLQDEHEVVAATRAADALARLAKGERFDVILCDLMMPEMTGMDFHAEVTKLDAKQAASIVFVTGGAFTQRAREFLDRVQNRTVEKPFSTVQLRTLINERLR